MTCTLEDRPPAPDPAPRRGGGTAGSAGELLDGRFSGPEPRVPGDEEPRDRGRWRRLRVQAAAQPLTERVAELLLNFISSPWAIDIEGGVSGLAADLSGLTLRELTIAGGVRDVALLLPVPEGHVPVRIEGGASKLSITRPAGAVASLRIGG